MRLLAAIAFAVLAGCTPPPAPVQTKPTDPTQESWYAPTVEQLATLARDAGGLFRSGKSDEAAALVTQGQPLMARVISVPRPTLAAAEASSDLDRLYGQMLLKNRHYGWARLLFQKNLARWKNWRPQTEDTVRRRKTAESDIAECDRQLAH